MNTPDHLHYTEDHEWANYNGNEVTIGITDFAQSQLGDVIFVELPEVGEEIIAGESFGEVEAVKTVSELFAPISGTICAVNEDLEGSPDKVNADPYGDGWLIKVTPSNVDEKKDFYNFWRKKGFMVFGFDVNDRLKGVRDFDNKIKLPLDTSKKIKMFVLKHLGKLMLPTCSIAFICVYIKADGGVVQCFNDWSNENIIENINDKKIKEIFHNDKYKKIRKKLLADKLDDSVICSKCDLYREGIWLTA